MALAVDLVRRGAARFPDRTAVLVRGPVADLPGGRRGRQPDRPRADRAGRLAGRPGRPARRQRPVVDLPRLRLPQGRRGPRAAQRAPLGRRAPARMLEETGAAWLVHGPELAEAAAALCDHGDGLRAMGLGGPGAAGGPDLLQESATAPAEDPNLPAEARRPGADPLHLGHDRRPQGGRAHAGAATPRSRQHPGQPGLTRGPDSVMLHAASLIHASGTFVLPYWMRGGAPPSCRTSIRHATSTRSRRYRATEINLVPTMLGMLLRRRRPSAPTSPACGPRSTARARCRGRCWTQALELWGPRLRAVLRPDGGAAGDHRARRGATTPTRPWPAPAGSRPSTPRCGSPPPTARRWPPARSASSGCARRSRWPATTDAAELTAETVDADGWVRTRDLARFDDRGYLYLVDRTQRHDHHRRLQRLPARGRGRPDGAIPRSPALPSSALPTPPGSRR